MNWVLIVCIVILFTLVILQIFWIRFKLAHIESTTQNKELQIKKQVNYDNDVTNRLQVYGLKVDCTIINTLNNANTKNGQRVLELVSPKKFSLPHVCNGDMKMVDIDVYQVGVLVVYLNQGAEDLYQDIISNKIRYMIINSKFFFVMNDVAKTLQNAVYDMNIPDVSNVISDRYMFLLYPVNSATPQDKTCSLHLTTFFGKLDSIQNNNALIDMKTLVGYSGEKQYPLHALGYKVA